MVSPTAKHCVAVGQATAPRPRDDAPKLPVTDQDPFVLTAVVELPPAVVVVRSPLRKLLGTRSCGFVTSCAADGEWLDPEGSTSRRTSPTATRATTPITR